MARSIPRAKTPEEYVANLRQISASIEESLDQKRLDDADRAARTTPRFIPHPSGGTFHDLSYYWINHELRMQDKD